MILCVHGRLVELTIDEVNDTEEELLQRIELLDASQKIRTRLSNLVKNRFRLERAIMWIEQQIQRRKEL